MQTVENRWLRETDAGVSTFSPGEGAGSADRARGRWTAPASAERGKMAQSLDTS